MVPFLVLTLLGLGLFYFQNLVLLPYVHLRLPSLLIFYASLQPRLALAFYLAGFLGLLQDSYALTPLGLHLNGALVLVAAGRLARRRFLMTSPGSQVLASLAALAAQEVGLRITLFLVGYPHYFMGKVKWLHLVEIVFTALLAPLLFSLLQALERVLRPWGWSAVTADDSS
jgi:rod shape-determining protein MreD|uniref:Rod shape-determining protein MreD n=1 Tax=Desulfobacca acetoxidans TaxID=60893 RepID=A0A7C3WQA0_9BACT